MNQIKVQNNQKENKLYDNAISIIDYGRKRIVDAIYNESTKSYYMLGKLIVENQQDGELKAEYGKKVIENLSKKLTIRYGKGFSISTLKDCRQFYQKSQSLTGELNFKLSFTHYTYLIRLDEYEMNFYEQYAIEHKLSVRELQKAVQSNVILRVSSVPKKLITKDTKPKEIIKDPYILDFLGLDEINTNKESVLEIN